MQTTEEKTHIQQLLLDMFSSSCPDDVLAVCEQNDFNIESCIDCLLTKEPAKDQTANSLRNNNYGAVPKNLAKNPKASLALYYEFSFSETKVINDIRSGYCIMIIMRGAPGSGKSSLARSIIKESFHNIDEQNIQDFIFSADDYFYDAEGHYEYKIEKLSEAHATNQRKVQEKAASGWSPIIVDNTNMQIWEMLPYIKTGLQNGYTIEILEPRTRWRKSAEQLAVKNNHGVSRDKIQNMLNKYERATIDDILKSIKDVKYFGAMPRMRTYPPIKSIQNSKNSGIVFPNIYQQRPIKNIKLNNELVQKSNHVREITEAPKAQRTQFLKKSMNQTAISVDPSSSAQIENSMLQISNDTIPNQPEDKLLGLLKESVSNISQSELEKPENSASNSNTFTRHAVNCPNENQVFAMLRRVYINKSISGLWDLFLKCNGDINWAVDILLKEDELFPSDNPTVENNALDDKYECSCGNVDAAPKQKEVSLSEVTEMNRNLRLRYVEQKNERLQAEQQRMKELVEERIVFGEEYYSKNIRREPNTRAGSSQSTQKLIDASTQTDVSEGNHENEMVEIDFDANILMQLNTIFQSETVEISDPLIRTNVNTKVFLPKSLAKDLYMLCMESVYNRTEEERQQTLREDENFAKLIHNLEYENYKGLTNNSQEFSDLKVSFQLLGLDLESERKFENIQQNPTDLATHLTILKLTDEYPETPIEVLLNVFQAQNNNYNETLKVLQENNIKRELGSQKQLSQNETMQEKPTAAYSSDVAKSITISPDEAKRLALSKFEESRNLAVHHCQLKAECYQKAKEMVQKGNSEVALYYSQIANLHKRKIEMYNQCAANSIVEVHKYSKNNPDLLDLHYLHVAEAMGCLDLFLDHHVSNLRTTSRTYKHVFIITGRGLHSSGGISAIKNKVKNRLKERNLRWNEVNPGLLKVKLFSNSRYSK